MVEKGILVSLLVVVAAEYLTPGTSDSNTEFLASKFVLLDLPENMDTTHPQHLVVRSNYEGSVVFVPSDKMKIEVNVTASSVQDLSKVWFNFTEYQGSLLFHLFHVDPPPESLLIYYVGLFIASISFISFLSSLIYVCWWRMCRKPDEDDKAPCPDSSQAPLLDGHIPTHSGQSNLPQNKTKKRIIKNPQHQVQTDESCVSSEDDLNETLPKKTPAPPKPLHRRDKFEMDSLKETFSSLPGPLTTPMSEVSSQSVSCILMEGMDPTSKKGAQYIRLAAGGKRFDADDKSGSLRQRRDPSGRCDVPDVVRTKGGSCREDVPSIIGGEGCSQYVTLSGPDVDQSIDAMDFRSRDFCSDFSKEDRQF